MKWSHLVAVVLDADGISEEAMAHFGLVSLSLDLWMGSGKRGGSGR